MILKSAALLAKLHLSPSLCRPKLRGDAGPFFGFVASTRLVRSGLSLTMHLISTPAYRSVQELTCLGMFLTDFRLVPEIRLGLFRTGSRLIQFSATFGAAVRLPRELIQVCFLPGIFKGAFEKQ